MNRVEYRNDEPVIILNGEDFGVEGEYEFFVNKNDREFDGTFVSKKDLSFYSKDLYQEQGDIEDVPRPEIHVATNEDGKVVFIGTELEDYCFAYVNDDNSLSDWNAYAFYTNEGLIYDNCESEATSTVKLMNGEILRNVYADGIGEENLLIVKEKDSKYWHTIVNGQKTIRFVSMIVTDGWQKGGFNAIIKLEDDGKIYLYNTNTHQLSENQYDSIRILYKAEDSRNIASGSLDLPNGKVNLQDLGNEVCRSDIIGWYCGSRGTDYIDCDGIFHKSKERLNATMDLYFLSIQYEKRITEEQFTNLETMLRNIDVDNYKDEYSFNHIKEAVASICKSYLNSIQPINYPDIVEQARELNSLLEKFHKRAVKGIKETREEIDNIFGV